MRDLTQQEIDNKPEWATHYVVCDGHDVMYESEGYWLSGNSGKERQPDYGLSNDAKEIPSKPFSLNDYDFIDDAVDYVDCDGGIVIFDGNNGNTSVTLYDADILAMAKHRKLI